MENWRDIKGFEGYYQVSDEGRVRSLDRSEKTSNGYIRYRKGRILKLHNKGNGYLDVCLCIEGTCNRLLVHRLVYETFHGEIPSGMQVNHINEVKTDNRLCNLNLMTPNENLNYGTHNERSAASRSKAVCGYDKEGNLVVSFPSTSEAQRNGYHSGHVSACARGKLKNHKGLYWKYEKMGDC